jgi:uncharacterized protein
VTTANRRLPAITLVPGQAQGRAFLLREALSFWGGFDAPSGQIIDRWHPQHGQVLSGQVLIMEAGRGSSSGSSVLAEAIRLGTGPSAIVLLTRDAIVTVGAMIAAELYAKDCPVVLATANDWPRIKTAAALRIVAMAAAAEIIVIDAEENHDGTDAPG